MKKAPAKKQGKTARREAATRAAPKPAVTKSKAAKSKAAKPEPAEPRTEAPQKALRDLSGYEVVDKVYEAHAVEGVSPLTGTVIHWWGQFSAELPEPFRLLKGGHGWLRARDLEHATALFEKLRAWVLAHEGPRKPGLGPERTKEWAGSGWHRWMLSDSRQMTVEFKVVSRLTQSQKKLVRLAR